MFWKFVPFFFLIVVPVTGQEPKETAHLEVSSYEDALSVAKENGRQVYLIFKGEGCVWCERQAEEILKPESNEAMNGLVVCTVDIHKRKDLRSKYMVKVVPSHRLLDSEGGVIRSASGYLNSSGLEEFLAP